MTFFRRGIILVLLCALLTGCVSALGEESLPFLFLDGLDWNSTPADLERVLGKPGVESTEPDASMLILTFEGISLPELETSADIIFYMSRDHAISIALYAIHANPAPEYSYNLVTARMEAEYSARGRKLFDSPIGLALQEITAKDDSLILSSLLSGAGSLLEYAYGDYTKLTTIEGWLVDERNLAVAVYGDGIYINRNPMFFVINFDQIYAMMTSGAENSPAGSFNRPAAVSWGMTAEETAAALEAAGISATVDAHRVSATLKDPSGNDMAWFGVCSDDGGLIGSVYTTQMDYLSVRELIAAGRGDSFMEDTDSLLQGAYKVIGKKAEHVSLFSGATEMTLLYDAGGSSVVVQFTVEYLNSLLN